MDAARERILRKYGVSPEARLSGGMEAEVYACGPDAVLKLYPGTASLDEMRILQAFYASLERERVPFALPRIHTVAQEEGWLVTVEQRLAGTRMSALLPALSAGELEAMMGRYLDAALAVSNLSPPPGFDRYKLLDAEGVSRRAEGDWHRFLARYLALKLGEVGRCLEHDVPQFADRVRALQAVLDRPYRGDRRLVHGDFFPGNLLVDGDGCVTALLDFGLMTMYGDYLFDVATGWVFFDMYDELEVGARARYLALLLDRLGEGVRGVLYRYVLVYSILSANTYSPACADGHYRWCVANLSNAQYWEAIE
jgi:Ser/Thr protein kinase RdoA (MazF antagonist)